MNNWKVSCRQRSLTGSLALVLVMVMTLALPGCLGPNHSVGHLARWNMEFENRWAREGVFLVCFPVYLLLGLGDILIFNPIQWWSGENPISRPDRPGPMAL